VTGRTDERLTTRPSLPDRLNYLLPSATTMLGLLALVIVLWQSAILLPGGPTVNAQPMQPWRLAGVGFWLVATGTIAEKVIGIVGRVTAENRGASA